MRKSDTSRMEMDDLSGVSIDRSEENQPLSATETTTRYKQHVYVTRTIPLNSDLDSNLDTSSITDCGLRFLALRIPVVKIQILPFLLHLSEFSFVIVTFLSLINVGVSQVFGDWVPPVLTALTFLYAIFGLIIAICRADPRMPLFIKGSSDRMIVDYGIREIPYTAADFTHCVKGACAHAILTLMWWIWYLQILQSNTNITFTSHPTAFMSQLALTGAWLGIEGALLWCFFFKNNIESDGLSASVYVLDKSVKK